MLSTPFQPNGNERFILLLEDIGGAIRALDRFLDQILYSDISNYIDAIILGDFNISSTDLIRKLLARKFKHNIQIPVYQFSGVGHGKHNHPIIMYAPIRMQRSSDGTFTLSYNK